MYFDSELPHRHQHFAARIHEENVCECMRLIVMDLKSKCACHRNDHNLFNPAITAVVGMLVIQKIGGKDVWISINAQAQKSVGECLAQSKMYAPIMLMVLSKYEKVPESRKVVSKSFLLGQDVSGWYG